MLWPRQSTLVRMTSGDHDGRFWKIASSWQGVAVRTACLQATVHLRVNAETAKALRAQHKRFACLR
jgi:hypothetical protein